MSGKYDDIIHLPHHTSSKRAGMSMTDRAAQFSPFAALTGYDEAIGETARLTNDRQELSEYRRMLLDESFRILLEHLEEQPEVRVTYFVADLTKDGGTYVTEEKCVKKVDLYRRELVTVCGDVIPMDDIWELEIT